MSRRRRRLGDARNSAINGGALSAAASFTRLSDAWAFVGTTYTQFSSNIARSGSLTIDGLNPGIVIEGARTNSIRNSTMVGAVVGTPGTRPTNWVASMNGAATGIAANVIATGTTNGMPYVDLQIVGTPSGTDFFLVRFDANTAITAASGEVWTQSAFIAKVAGATTNFSTIQFDTFERTAAGSFVTEGAGTDFKASLTSSLQYFSHTRTLSGGGTVARVQGSLRFNLSSGNAVDITIRIAAPQLELGAFASSFIPTSTVAITRAADDASTTIISLDATQGTVFADFKRSDAAAAIGYVASLDDGTSNETVYIRQDATKGNTTLAIIDGGASQFSLTTTAAGTVNARAKAAIAYKLNDSAAATAGSTPTTDTSCTLPTVTTLNIGKNAAGNYLFGTIQKLDIYSSRLENAGLTAITT